MGSGVCDGRFNIQPFLADSLTVFSVTFLASQVVTRPMGGLWSLEYS